MSDNSSVAQITNDPYASVRIPEFRNLVIGRFTFIFSLRMMSTLVGWWVLELTNDPFAIGLVGLSEFVPAFAFALYAGHVIDNSERKKMILKGVFAYLLFALCLLLFSTKLTSDHFSNQYIAIGIYVVIFGTGIARAFTGPSFSSLLAMIVPRQYLQNATTWNQGSWLAASVSGHAVGGFLIWLFGITGTLIVICSLLSIAFIVLTWLKRKPPIPQSGEINTWESVKEGLRFVFKTKEILGSFTLDMFAVLFGGAVAMVPVYARDILQVGPLGFGWLNAAIDIGAIFSVILLTFRPMKKAQGKKLFLAVAGFGICIIIFALSEWFLLSFAALLIAGVLDGISVVVRGTVMQLKTPDHMRGRVSSVGSMFINSSNELGQFESGFAARLMGVVPSVVFGGCMTLLVVIVTWWKAPTLRKFQY
ncbi:MAG: MFS transporter [Chitinophagaceae bacterium]|nr:MFS transporter [Chitinophagaceae bacterium]